METFLLGSGTGKYSDCDNIWKDSFATKGISNKYLYDKWLTSIIFTVFIILCTIGLAVFGLLTFLNPESSS